MATSGIIFKDGLPYYVTFQEPLPLDYVANFSRPMDRDFTSREIPVAGHQYIDAYLEQKDIANRIFESDRIGVPKSVVLLSQESPDAFINNRRRQADDVIDVSSYHGRALKRYVWGVLSDSLRRFGNAGES